jgi:uncharacterized protein YndB with AHSA1/START domain
MPKLEKSITIKAPVREVFAYIDKPAHLPEIWPSMFEVKDVKPLTNGGHKFQYTFNFAGKPIYGTTETFERVENKRIADKMYGDFDATYAWTFLGENGTTEVAFESDYKLPQAFVKDERFIARRNELEADAILANLKARVEA